MMEKHGVTKKGIPLYIYSGSHSVTKIMHSTTLSGLMSVETTVCVTNVVVSGWLSAGQTKSRVSQADLVNDVTLTNGLIRNCGKMDFLGNVSRERYLGRVSSTCRRYF